MAENNGLENLKAKVFDENTPWGKALLSIKNTFAEMPKKKRNIIFGVAGGVVVLAAVLALVLNAKADKYVALYQGLESSEATAIYQELLADGIDAQLDSTGNVVVPKEIYDQCLLMLAAEGYPKTALTYDIFENSQGLTATESDRKQALIHQAQERLQGTLMRIKGVQDAVVNLAIPDNTDYVWEQVEDASVPTASVTITFNDDIEELSDEQITAIKNLVASAIPDLTPENVVLTDAKTMLELKVDEDAHGGLGYQQNLDFERMVQSQIEENVIRILTPKYGSDGVFAVAKVTINYDKMMTEKMELIPNSKEEGFLTHEEGTFQGGPEDVAGGVAGEENNTDIPDYQYNSGSALDGETLIEGLRDYDYGYIKTQIEKGNAILDKATVSVMVKQANLSNTNRDEIINIVSKSVDIDPENISVSSFVGEEPIDDVVIKPTFIEKLLELPLWQILLIFGIILLVALLLVLIPVIIISKKRKKKKKDGMEEYLQQIEDERAAEQLQLQQEIDRYKKELADIAMGDADPKDEAILKEVRNFAKANPKITANLLRSWIKEGDD
ncbi:MAG: flagellar M-ring protein FliF [Ruminococcaceae bacterium]|nr:flagellar M-ring protein FliF [Oscillospiraceae bacterium]